MNRKRKSSTKKRIFAVATALIIMIAIIAWAQRPKAIAYESTEAKTGDITTFYSFSGNVETKNRETVVSEKVMQISDINVKEGDLVEEGDLLFTTTTEDEVKASIDGEISQINIEENGQVMAGIPLIEIVDYDNLQIKVKVDEYDISALEEEKEATVTIDAIDKEIKGTIASISKEGQVVNGVSFFTATIDLEKDTSVRVGMTAEVKLQSTSITDVVILPMSYIQFDDNNQPYVYTLDDKDILVKTDITTGLNDGTSVEIVSGVSNQTTIYDKDTATTSTGGMGFARGNRGE